MNKADREHCLKCVWHGVASASETSGQLPYCNYSAVYGHESRIKRHYDRVGKEDLMDFRSGVGCYEFFEGDSKRAKTLMTDDSSRVMRPGWELLAEVAAHEEGRKYAPPEPTPKPKAKQRPKAGAKEKPEKVKAPREKYRKGSFSRGKINANVAEKLFEQYGIDATRKEDDE